MLIRSHRETLDEAMRTVAEVHTIEEVQEYLQKNAMYTEINKEDISFEHGIFDDRIGWDTYYVLVKGQCHGFSNGTL
jgi:hypothetical protein